MAKIVDPSSSTNKRAKHREVEIEFESSQEQQKDSQMENEKEEEPETRFGAKPRPKPGAEPEPKSGEKQDEAKEEGKDMEVDSSPPFDFEKYAPKYEELKVNEDQWCKIYKIVRNDDVGFDDILPHINDFGVSLLLILYLIGDIWNRFY